MATGPSFMVSPKNGSMASQAMWKVEPSLPLTFAAVSWPSAPSRPVTWPSTKSILPSLDQRHHLVDAVGRGAELVAPVQQREVRGERREIERPVERAVAAADDQDLLAAERLHLAHGVVHRLAFIGLDAGHRRALRLERAAAGRDHHDLALEHLAAVGGDAEQPDRRCARCVSTISLRWNVRAERLDLLHQRVDQPLRRRSSGSPECRRSASRDKARRTGRRPCRGCRRGAP